MSGYQMKRAHPFFDMTRWLVDSEIRMGCTVCFANEVDLTEIEAARARFKRQYNRKVGYTAFVLHALSRALMECPGANRRLHKPFGWPFRGLRIQQFDGADIAVAVERNINDAESAVFIDVMRDAQERSVVDLQDWLDQLAKADTTNNQQWRSFHNLIERAPRWLAGLIAHLPTYSPALWSRYRGGAAMVSSPTKYGVDSLVGAWTAPIGVSFGYAKERPVVRNGQVVSCKTFSLVLNFDRRMLAGAQAARFFKSIVDRMEYPSLEWPPLPAPVPEKEAPCPAQLAQ